MVYTNLVWQIFTLKKINVQVSQNHCTLYKYIGIPVTKWAKPQCQVKFWEYILIIDGKCKNVTSVIRILVYVYR